MRARERCVRGLRLGALVLAYFSCAPALAQLSGSQAPKNADELYTLGIIGGEPDLTEFTLANDLASVFSRRQESGPRGQRIRLLAVAGTGGAQDVRDLLKLNGIDLAIVSLPVLNRLRETRELGAIENKIVYLWRMPDQEVHLLAAPEVRSIEDLRGKTVNFGPPGAGSVFIARRLFDASNVKVAEAGLRQPDALEAMRNGTVAATVLVTGKPAPVLQHLAQVDGFHFLPIERPDGFEGARTSLTSADYPNLIAADGPVATLAVSDALVARVRPPDSSRARLLAYFVETIFARLDDLRRPGRHPKWRELDLDARIPNWKRYGPVTRSLARERDLSTGSAPSRDEAGSTREEEEKLFQEFLKWREQQRKMQQGNPR